MEDKNTDISFYDIGSSFSFKPEKILLIFMLSLAIIYISRVSSIALNLKVLNNLSKGVICLHVIALIGK